MFVDFPDDSSAWTVEDQFLFGPDLLVAPVTEFGARSRPVHLPAGTAWIDVHTGIEHAGGVTVEAQAPLARIPVFRRAGSTLHL